MNSRTQIASLLALLAAACAPDFTPPTEVHGLRVLAVRVEPPELAAPGDPSAPVRAELASLVGHPAFATDAGRRATVLHLACTPEPGSAAVNPCTALTTLADPTVLLPYVDLGLACSAPGLGDAGAITFAGLESCGQGGCLPATVLRDPADGSSLVRFPAPAYEVPTDADLAALPVGDPLRVLGMEIVIVSLALDAAPEELAPTSAVPDDCAALAAVAARFAEAWPSRANETSLKRVLLRGPEAPSAPNQNPLLTAISLDGEPLPVPGELPAPVPGGAKRDLYPVLPGSPGDLAEKWIEVDEEGQPVRERTEEWSYAWFTTGGELEDPYTRAVSDPAKLTAPGTGPFLVWLVVRDLRGGIAWSAGSLQAGP